MHPVFLESDTYEVPEMADSPVSSGIFFPGGYGREVGGKVDHDVLNNNQENVESVLTCYFENGKEVGRTCESEHEGGVSDQTRVEGMEVEVDSSQSVGT